MRLLAIFLLLVLVVPSGLDAVARIGDDAACADCEDEGEAACSPACPDCIHSFGARLLAAVSPQLVIAPAVDVPPRARSMPLAAVSRPPCAPFLSGVFHPPRA